LAPVSLLIASSFSYSRVFIQPGNTIACKYKSQYHIVHETGYRTLLSLLAGIAIPANLQPRYNDPKATVARDLPFELFKHIADEL
jgi:hypothetical protein